ncbi:MAG: alpha/beta fold hydrolase [Chloroflexi bacterium]|nr:alpha/beta fold hydrolase [Chloroflexota bacterium]
MSQGHTPQSLIYELTDVSGPSLSPDGTQLVFVRSKVDKEAMETSSQIMRMELPNGEIAQFTSGSRDGAPRFSPDGKSVAFLRPDDKGRKQIWIIPTSAGEARKLTSAIAGVTELSWSPQSNALVFVSNVDPDQLPEDHDPKKDPRVRVVRRIRYRFDSVGWRGDGFRKLFVADAKNGDIDYPAMPDEKLEIIARNRESFARFCWQPYMHNPKLKRRLHRISVPTLVIWGAADGVITTDYGKAYADEIPGARFEVIENGGHFPHLEQPEHFMEVLGGFLADAQKAA